MKRLIFIFNGLLFSGAEMMTLSSAKYLSDKFILEAVETSSGYGNASQRFRDEGFRLHHVQTEFSKLTFSSTLLFLKAILSLCIIFSRPNTVVHVHTERYRLLYCLLAKLLHCKVITTIHHIYPLSSNPFKRHFQIFVRRLRRQILYIFGVKKISNSLTGHKLELERYQSNNALIFNWFESSQFSYPSSSSFTMTDVLALPNVSMSNPLRSLLDGNSINFNDYTFFLSVGASRSYKNYSKAIESFEIFSRKFSSIKSIYLIVGNDLDGSISSSLDGCFSSNIIHVTGVEDLSALINLCHILFMPSTEEGFGVACVEAISSGLYPLLSDVPALSDFKPIISSGVWVKSLDSASLALDLKKAYDQNKSFSHKNKLAQSQSFISRFSIEKNFHRLIDMYS